jgi:hypothetical protein
VIPIDEGAFALAAERLVAFSFHSRADSRRTESLFLLSEITLSNLIDRPLISKSRSSPSSADRLTEAIYTWEPVRPLCKPRHQLTVSPDLRPSFPFPQARRDRPGSQLFNLPMAVGRHRDGGRHLLSGSHLVPGCELQLCNDSNQVEQLGRPVERHDADRRPARRNEQRDQFRKGEYSGAHIADQRGILKPPRGSIRSGRSDRWRLTATGYSRSPTEG